jgi:glycosyltransferase involved in cell wall biosynthesis
VKVEIMARKKRILVIHPSPVFGGGAIESLVDFLNSIHREKFDILLMIPDSQPLISGLSHKTEQKNIIRYSLTENDNIFLYTITLIKFLYYLLWEKIDLIYVSDWSVIWKPSELLAAKILQIPIIAHIRVPLEKGPMKSFIRFSALVIGNSEFTLKEARDMKLPVKRIYNSINVKKFDSDKSSIVPTKGSIKIAFVGRVRIRKGVMVFIEAAREVLQKYQDTHFYVVGNDSGDSDGCLDAAKETVNIRKISPYFTFTDLLYDAPQFMKHIDIVVVPSIFEEPFGRVNIEAMAAGKPVIASRVGGIPEVVEDHVNGLLVPKGDTDALAKAMIKLIDNGELRRRLGENGRISVEEKFDTKKQIKDLEDIFYENSKP